MVDVTIGPEHTELLGGANEHDGVFDEDKPDAGLNAFLASWKPGTPETRSQKWIWVKRSEKKTDIHTKASDKIDEAVDRAKAIGKQAAEKAEDIKNDESIPTRASKKNPRNKKIAREELHKQTQEKLEELAKETGLTSGKWLLYCSTSFLEFQWNTITRSMIDETLSKTDCFAAKVATEPSPESANHVIAVYVPDSWDKEAVAKVGKALVEDLEFNVSAFKPDIYSYADISSKHPSQMRSSLYTPWDFVDKKAHEAKKQAEKDAKKAKPKRKEEDDEAGDGFEDESDEDEKPAKKKSKS